MRPSESVGQSPSSSSCEGELVGGGGCWLGNVRLSWSLRASGGHSSLKGVKDDVLKGLATSLEADGPFCRLRDPH